MKILLRGICWLALACGLTACSTTSSELRSDPRVSKKIVISLPFEQVRLNIAQHMDRCFRGGVTVSHFHWESADPIPGQHTVLEMVQEGLARRVLISIDVRRIGDASELTYFIGPYAVFADWDKKIRSWASGETNRASSC